jgi:hypothetical protein
MLIALASLAPPDSSVSAIDEKVKRISGRLTLCRVSERGFDANNTKKTYFYSGAPVLVEWLVQHDAVRKTVKWYFEDDRLIFCQQRWETLVPEASGAPLQVTSNEKIYIHYNHVIAWIDTKGVSRTKEDTTWRALDGQLPMIAGKLIFSED